MRKENIILISQEEAEFIVKFKWSLSRGRDTYGWTICTAYVDDVKVGGCNGGGYDMEGAALSGWMERMVRPEDKFYGLTWHDPNYRIPKEILDREMSGESLGLERYQDFYSASSPIRTERHTIPRIEGGTGLDYLLRQLGFKVRHIS